MATDNRGRKVVKIPAALHQKINVASAELDRPIYVLLEEAWAAYTSTEAPEASDRNRNLHAMLDEILERTDEESVTRLLHALPFLIGQSDKLPEPLRVLDEILTRVKDVQERLNAGAGEPGGKS